MCESAEMSLYVFVIAHLLDVWEVAERRQRSAGLTTWPSLSRIGSDPAACPPPRTPRAKERPWRAEEKRRPADRDSSGGATVRPHAKVVNGSDRRRRGPEVAPS